MPNIIVGLLALAFGLWGLSIWWWSVTEILRGLVPLVLLGIGFVALAAGITKVQTKEKNTGDENLDDELINEFETTNDSQSQSDKNYQDKQTEKAGTKSNPPVKLATARAKQGSETTENYKKEGNAKSQTKIVSKANTSKKNVVTAKSTATQNSKAN